MARKKGMSSEKKQQKSLLMCSAWRGGGKGWETCWIYEKRYREKKKNIEYPCSRNLLSRFSRGNDAAKDKLKHPAGIVKSQVVVFSVFLYSLGQRRTRNLKVATSFFRCRPHISSSSRKSFAICCVFILLKSVSSSSAFHSLINRLLDCVITSPSLYEGAFPFSASNRKKRERALRATHAQVIRTMLLFHPPLSEATRNVNEIPFLISNVAFNWCRHSLISLRIVDLFVVWS